MALEPGGGRTERAELVLALEEGMALVLEEQVLDLASPRAELLDDLLRLSGQDARVLRSLDD